MKLVDLVVLLPCHSLDDFPQHQQGEPAEGLLSAWSALWHPALIASAGKTPGWHRVDDPPADVAGKLLVLPSVSQNELPAGFAARVTTEGGALVRKLVKRSEIVATALAHVDGGAGHVSPAMVADFHALGICYLQTELLTRRMRYLSNLDEPYFQGQVVAAATSAMAGDEAAATLTLNRSFEVLAEVRGHYYPNDTYLIDLTLVAPTTMGASLRNQLAAGVPTNVLIAGNVLNQMAQQEPATLDALRQAVAQGTVCLVGGEFSESDLPLLSIESIRAQLMCGLSHYEQHLGARPTIYGRRRFGLTPVLPQLLKKLGFTGALHVTLDDGQFPASERSKTRWEGVDGSSIDALGRVPLDANLPGSFLGLPEKLGDTMDHDHVATLCFAHWPGLISPFYEDVQRIAAHGHVLGKFVTLDHYFTHTDSTGQFAQFQPDRYRSPYLHQAIVRKRVDPISSYVRQTREQALAATRQSLNALGELLAKKPSGDPATKTSDAACDCLEADVTASADREQTLMQQIQAAGNQLATALPTAPAASSGYLIANACSFSRRIGVDVSGLESLPTIATPVVVAGQSASGKHAVVEVPAMGFAWIGPGAATRGKAAAAKPIAVENVLRNEFCEVTVHPRSGGIQSIRDLKTRGNRLSQQIAFRLPPARSATASAWASADEPAYSSMVADAVQTTVSNAARGEIVSRGRLLDADGKRVAGYTQKTQLWAGSRVVLVDITLEVAEEPRADPWNSYYAARFAWSDATAELRRSVNMGSHVTEAKRFEAPHFVEVRSGELRTTVLTGGLPFHQRTSRFLDSLLVVRGETARKFQFGIGLDLPQPLPAALDLLTPPVIVQPATAPPEGQRSGWFFHIDVKNVVATDWTPLLVDGNVVGVRVRLLETSGRPTKAAMRSFRKLTSAQQTDLLGREPADLPVSEDRVELEFSCHEWKQLELKWA